MRVREVIWLPEIEDKLWEKHHLTVAEAEELLFGELHIRFVEKGHRPDENLYAAYGQTKSGRHVIVFFVLKQGRQALVISARDMDSKERKTYGRR
ncbi:BrnT family toxin [Candidatus Amarolinea aalborgensis]|uniref:BrnT family toxin n=1 Tax=Candidatus Amarolinea aalborgensis TaxID=2249329 RepID=UPI003BF9B13D